MVRKNPWNDVEEFVFIEGHKIHGNKWAEIAKLIPGRYIISNQNIGLTTPLKIIFTPH